MQKPRRINEKHHICVCLWASKMDGIPTALDFSGRALTLEMHIQVSPNSKPQTLP